MKAAENIFLFILVVAALQLAVSGLVLLLAISLVAALIVRPRESIGLILLFLFVGLIQAYPIVGIILIGAVGVDWLVRKLKGRRAAKAGETMLLLPGPGPLGGRT